MGINKILPYDDIISELIPSPLPSKHKPIKSKDLRVRSLLFWDVVLYHWETGD
jgi:hypothetical protein